MNSKSYVISKEYLSLRRNLWENYNISPGEIFEVIKAESSMIHVYCAKRCANFLIYSDHLEYTTNPASPATNQE